MPVFGSSPRFRPKTKLKRFGGDLGGLLTDLLEERTDGIFRRLATLDARPHRQDDLHTALQPRGENSATSAVATRSCRNASRTGALDLLCHSREFRTGDYEEIMNKASCLSLVSNAFSMNTPEPTTAAALPRYFKGKILADSTSIQWSGLYVRRIRNAPVVDRLLVPATPEPSISCAFAGWTLNGRGLTSDWL
jgi:hypothetical protein